MLKEIFMKMLRTEKERFDYIYDWNETKKNKIKKYNNLGFYCKSNELEENNMNLNDDNRPIIAQGLNYAEMAEKMQNDLNNKENKNEQEKEKVKTNEEKQSTCCFIF